jgi:hypothetical protein
MKTVKKQYLMILNSSKTGGKYILKNLIQALSEIEQQFRNIQWQNNRSGRTGGFALISFGNFVLGQYLQEIGSMQ